MSKCIGCGVTLQNIDSAIDGYVQDINNNVCQRCFIIKNYGQDKATSQKNFDYNTILSRIKKDDVVVYVSSILTLNLDYIDKFNNVILVLTKRDMLPKSIKDNKIIEYVKRRYNISCVLVVSSYKKYNLDFLYSILNKYNKKDIYFVGLTNSGKSTLINEMIKSYTGVSGNITMSNFPSTTLDFVNVNINDLCIKDTPGIIIPNSFVNYLNIRELKKINSKKEIKPITFQIKNNGAILIDEYFKIEYETNSSSMTFYMSNNLNITSISLKNSKFVSNKYKGYKIVGNQDLVIEDVGFIKFTGLVNIKIYYIYDAYMYVRDKLV